jgi:hypothetical protein
METAPNFSCLEVDDITWNHHLRRSDYSRWFCKEIKDEELAAEAERVESMDNVAADESRKLIKAAIEERYTLPGRGLTFPSNHSSAGTREQSRRRDKAP